MTETRKLDFLDLTCSKCKKLACNGCMRFRFLDRQEFDARELHERQRWAAVLDKNTEPPDWGDTFKRPGDIRRSKTLKAPSTRNDRELFERPPLMARSYTNRPLPELPPQPGVARSSAVRDPTTHRPIPHPVQTYSKAQSFDDQPWSFQSIAKNWNEKR